MEDQEQCYLTYVLAVHMQMQRCDSNSLCVFISDTMKSTVEKHYSHVFGEVVSFTLSERQRNCTRSTTCNTGYLPPWQRKVDSYRLNYDEQEEFAKLLLQERDARRLHDLKHIALRSRLQKNGVTTTWESRNVTTACINNATFTRRLPGSPNCNLCYEQHCPLRTLTAVELPPPPKRRLCYNCKLALLCRRRRLRKCRKGLLSESEPTRTN